MALNATNARVAITGAVYKAPLGSTAPTNATAAVAAAYIDLGYISSDGITEGWDDSVSKFTAWQNATTIRSAITDSTGTLKFSMLETKGRVLTAFHRGSTMAEAPAGNFTLSVKPITADPSAWIFDVVDGAKLIRIYVANGEITERGEITYANGDMLMYPVTVTFYPDSNGNLMQKFSNDTAWTAS